MKDTIITKFSMAFIKRYRITILLFLATIILGFISYQFLLKREGFPAIEVPYTVVTTPYFVDDPEKVNTDITVPLEEKLLQVNDIKQVKSTTNNNFSIIVAEFKEGIAAEKRQQTIEQDILGSIELPNGAEPEISSIEATKYLNKYDMLVSVSGDKTAEELQKKADQLAAQIEESESVIHSETIYQVSSQTNPITGETFDYQSSFDRVGIKENEEIKFYPAISIGIIKKEGVEAIDLSDAVHEVVDQQQEAGNLDGYQVSFTGDIAEQLTNQINSLGSNGITGLIAVFIIVMIFISWRASINAAVFMPTVILGTFGALYVIGYSLNVISLFALILVLGLFVDDAIVIIEAIDRKRKEGYKRFDAIKRAINEIGVADIVGTLTTTLVFLPLAFISGILGDFIRAVPVTVIIALLLSLVFALTVIPALSSVTIFARGKGKQGKVSKTVSKIFYAPSMFIDYLGSKVGQFVGYYLSSWKKTIPVAVITLLLILGGGFFASKLKFSVFPTPKDTVSYSVSIGFSEGTQLPQAEVITKDVEKMIVDASQGEIQSTNTLNANTRNATIVVNLTPIGDRSVTSVEIVDELNQSLASFDKANATAAVTSAGPPPQEYPFAMQVYSDDQKVLEKSTEEFTNFINNLELSSGTIEEVQVEGIYQITKNDGKRYAEVKVKPSDNEDTGIILEIQNAIEDQYGKDQLATLGLSEDALGFDFGQNSDTLKSFNSALLALVVALLIMYGILVFQYNSFIQPLLIFLAIPLSFPILFPGLFATNNSMSFFVTVGLIGLIGIVVNNTIMLVEFGNQNRKSGDNDLGQAISKGVNARFRPIITTTSTTIAGLLPLALTDPFWEPLAFTIIFGLISSSLLV
ncbi:efflux RND transporter permease subunit, partial [Candidatus Dojkabacteria bacterium]|nr:efflux RND transporter permease subunit [Candidatus Dojkabacteria bacterium]